MSELNITPLLDLVFVLLVIFIITTPQMMNNLEMNAALGQAAAQDKPDKPKINKIVVDAEGPDFLNDEPVTHPALQESWSNSRRTIRT